MYKIKGHKIKGLSFAVAAMLGMMAMSSAHALKCQSPDIYRSIDQLQQKGIAFSIAYGNVVINPDHPYSEALGQGRCLDKACTNRSAHAQYGHGLFDFDGYFISKRKLNRKKKFTFTHYATCLASWCGGPISAQKQRAMTDDSVQVVIFRHDHPTEIGENATMNTDYKTTYSTIQSPCSIAMFKVKRSELPKLQQCLKDGNCKVEKPRHKSGLELE